MRGSFAFHVIGIVLWVGGLIILPRVLKALKGLPEEYARPIFINTQRVFWGFVVSGLAVALLSGLHQFTAGGVGNYLTAGWFHAKLMFLLVLLAATVLLYGELKGSVATLNPKKLMAIHGMSALSLVVIVFLTFLGR